MHRTTPIQWACLVRVQGLSKVSWKTRSHTHTNLVLRESLVDTSRHLLPLTHRTCHRWARWWTRRGEGRLSVDCCYSYLLDLLRVKTLVCSYNLHTTPFLSYPSQITLVKLITLKKNQNCLSYFGEIDWTQKEPKLCVQRTRQREKERQRRQRGNKVFFNKYVF
jgi:hypothetical protein